MPTRLHKAAVTDFCESIARAFVEGQMERLSGFYIHPLTIYLSDGVRIEIDPEETIRAVFHRRSVALASGVKDVKVVIHDIGEIRDDRFTVRLDWLFVGSTGETLTTSRLRYFCRAVGEGEFRIAMIEFIAKAFPRNPALWTDGDKRH